MSCLTTVRSLACAAALAALSALCVQESPAPVDDGPRYETPRRHEIPPDQWAANLTVPLVGRKTSIRCQIGFSNNSWGVVVFGAAGDEAKLEAAGIPLEVRTEDDPTSVCVRSPTGRALYVAQFDEPTGVVSVEEWRLVERREAEPADGDARLRVERRLVFQSRPEERMAPVLAMCADSKYDRLWLLTSPVTGPRIDRLQLGSGVGRPADLERMSTEADFETLVRPSRLRSSLYEDGRFVVIGMDSAGGGHAIAAGIGRSSFDVILFVDMEWDGVVDQHRVVPLAEFRKAFPPGTGWVHTYDHPPPERSALPSAEAGRRPR